MIEQVLVVRSAELQRQIPFQRFKALPEEEFQRLQGAIEVTATDPDTAGPGSGYQQLVAYTVVHHNYSWLTYLPDGATDAAGQRMGRALGVGAPLLADGRETCFLDEQWQRVAARTVDGAFAFGDRYELRLAGLLDDDDGATGHRYLGLVYVARLLRPGATARAQGIEQVRFFGNGELQMQRAEFDSWSQTLIDHLPAL